MFPNSREISLQMDKGKLRESRPEPRIPQRCRQSKSLTVSGQVGNNMPYRPDSERGRGRRGTGGGKTNGSRAAAAFSLISLEDKGRARLLDGSSSQPLSEEEGVIWQAIVTQRRTENVSLGKYLITAAAYRRITPHRSFTTAQP